MTNLEQIAVWHTNKPAWAKTLTARDWSIAELIAEQLDAAAEPELSSCLLAGPDHYCTQPAGHAGPCVTHAWES